MTVDPHSERDQEQLGGVQDGSHPEILAVIKHRSARLQRGGLFGQDEVGVERHRLFSGGSR